MIVEWVQHQSAKRIRLLNMSHAHDFMGIYLFIYFFTQNQTKSCKINIWAKFAELLGVLQVIKSNKKTFNQFFNGKIFEPLCVLTFWVFLLAKW